VNVTLLDLSSLEKALASLQVAIERSRTVPDDAVIRDAVIQRFEYSYELCWRMLKRILERESPVPASIDGLSYRDLMREGGERGIVANVEDWLVFRSQRNISSHTYDEAKARSVYRTALEFLPAAQALLLQLQERNR
jgi:nucleotidyltransferase substrate binding protein (TIGR01987 family)